MFEVLSAAVSKHPTVQVLKTSAGQIITFTICWSGGGQR